MRQSRIALFLRFAGAWKRALSEQLMPPRFVHCGWDHPVMYEGGAAILRYRTRGALRVHVSGRGWQRAQGLVAIPLHGGDVLLTVRAVGLLGLRTVRLRCSPVKVRTRFAKPRPTREREPELSGSLAMPACSPELIPGATAPVLRRAAVAVRTKAGLHPPGVRTPFPRVTIPSPETEIEDTHGLQRL